MKNKNTYTTDDRVEFFNSFDINKRLGEIIGQRFIDYRKQWDLANSYDLETDFPLFIQLDMDQICNLMRHHN